MFSFTNQLYNVQKSFMKLSIQVYTQTRGKKGGYGHLHRPRLRNPVWFVKKERILRNDEVTPENINFVKDVVANTYGPPAVIGGVHTYKSLLKVEPPSPQEWKPGLKRTGVIARKIGVYPLWLKDGTKILTTLLHIVDNHVVKYIPPEEYKPPRKRAYPTRGKYPKGCLLVGAESVDPSLYTKEYCGLFERAGIMPKRLLARFLISPEAALQTGTPLTAAHFKVGDIVDVRGKTIDRGFQGVMKRWGFKGQPASHGQTKTHRRPGNIGGGGEKGRVWPGKKMPGHMGNRWRIIKGVKIWRINTKYNVLYVSGVSVPGETNSYCYIYDTILPLKRHKTAPHFPTLLDSQLEEPLPEDIWDDELHKFDEPTIEFVES